MTTPPDFAAWLSDAVLHTPEAHREALEPMVFNAMALANDAALWDALRAFGARLSPHSDISDAAAALIAAGLVLAGGEDPLARQMRERALLDYGAALAGGVEVCRAALRRAAG